MASLHTALAGLESIIGELRRVPQLTGPDRVKTVIELRIRVVAQVAAVNQAIASDPGLLASPELAKEYAARFGAIRAKLAGFQAKWRGTNLAEDFDAYVAESVVVTEAFAGFLTWTKQA